MTHFSTPHLPSRSTRLAPATYERRMSVRVVQALTLSESGSSKQMPRLHISREMAETRWAQEIGRAWLLRVCVSVCGLFIQFVSLCFFQFDQKRFCHIHFQLSHWYGKRKLARYACHSKWKVTPEGQKLPVEMQLNGDTLTAELKLRTAEVSLKAGGLLKRNRVFSVILWLISGSLTQNRQDL